MDYIEVKLKVIHNLGTFESEIMELTNEQYKELELLSHGFWMTDSCFKIYTNSGVVFFPPEIASKSVLVIEIINDNGNNE